ncbi:MBL fold metallo-hydrolase [Stenotrophomonas sp. 24(2023)]|uniref:MBL fold metallo-hydrolase n=1 Tax=Stenotrophomonas sp. 24(2023) TaxID=3068324 RepID=UPI0027DF5230|nr:MBL fold metallo-hydrolase [Stenotrophomonas sp. 24(2023)]WMJ69342.1 MBL fold metallo-hydrolase [Stenotrophomonas sp. 24(2023)]
MADILSRTTPATPRRGRIRRALRWSALGAASLLLALLALFLVTGCAAFGGTLEGQRLVRAQQSPQWSQGQFQNPQPLWADSRGAWRRLLFGSTPDGQRPDAPVPVVHTDPALLESAPASGLRVTWFGHSSALVEIDGSRVLVDPFWSERASPVSWAGPKRWFAPPIALADLPPIDVVVVSHDHVDHLDYGTIVALRGGNTRFVVPLGIGAHLEMWGIPAARITELDWWQQAQVGTLAVVATPARHGSGRVLDTKHNHTLWAGFALIGPHHRAWYSGDTGLHDTLDRIGREYGPFDVTLVEAGQYDSLWPDTHLGPELAVEAHRRVQGRVMIPVHWALIGLAPHPWTEPAERVLAAAACQGVSVRIPRPGESVEPTVPGSVQRWWPRQAWRTAAQAPVLATRDGDPAHRVEAPACMDGMAAR